MTLTDDALRRLAALAPLLADPSPSRTVTPPDATMRIQTPGGGTETVTAKVMGHHRPSAAADAVMQTVWTLWEEYPRDVDGHAWMESPEGEAMMRDDAAAIPAASREALAMLLWVQTRGWRHVPLDLGSDSRRARMAAVAARAAALVGADGTASADGLPG